MSEICEHDWQNLGFAFCTVFPPIDMQVCTKCGERRGHQEELPAGEPTSVKCDIDGGMMSVSKMDGEVYFRCQTCEQVWIYRRHGDEINSSCTILGHLWPSRMEEGSKMWREQYLPSWISGQKHKADALLVADFYTKKEHDEMVARSEDALSEAMLKFPEHKLRFWQKDPLKYYGATK